MQRKDSVPVKSMSLADYQEKIMNGDTYPTAANVIPVPGISIRKVAMTIFDRITGDLRAPGTVDPKLFKTYLELEHVAASNIRGYNHFIEKILPNRLAHYREYLPTSLDPSKRDWFTFELIPPGAEPPMIEIEGKLRPMLPEDAVTHDRTYSMMIKAKLWFHYHNKKERKEAGEIELGKLPIMVKSNYCWLSKPQYNANTVEGRRLLLESGECPNNPGGYFVVKGAERVVLLQENLRTNRPFVFVSKKKQLGKGQQKTFYTARMTVNTPTGSTLIRLEQGQGQGQRSRNQRTIDIMLKFMDKNQSGQPNMLNVFQVFRLVGSIIDREAKTKDEKAQEYAKLDTALKTVLIFVKSDWHTKIVNVLYPSLFTARSIPNDMKSINDKKRRNVDFAEIEAGLRDDLFPQVSVEKGDSWSPRTGWLRRYMMLAHMVAEMASVMDGLRPIDDRDSWSNKKLESPARSMERLFFTCFDSQVSSAKENLKRENSTPEQLRNVFTQQNILTESFVTSMISSNWGLKNSANKENLTDSLPRNNVLASQAVIRRINAPTSRKTKTPSIRMINGSQFNYICYETPEGSNCGLVKNLAIGAIVSLEEPEEQQKILEILDQLPKVTGKQWLSYSGPNSYAQARLFVNSVFYGWVPGPDLRDLLVDLRRKKGIPGLKKIDPFTTILLVPEDKKYNPNAVSGDLYVFTDAGRLLAPYLVVNKATQKLVMDEIGLTQELIDGNNVNIFNKLLNAGAIEFLDPWELEYSKLAIDLNSLTHRLQDIRAAQEGLELAQQHMNQVLETGSVIVAKEATPVEKEVLLTEELAMQRYQIAKSQYDVLTTVEMDKMSNPERQLHNEDLVKAKNHFEETRKQLEAVRKGKEVKAQAIELNRPLAEALVEAAKEYHLDLAKNLKSLRPSELPELERRKQRLSRAESQLERVLQSSEPVFTFLEPNERVVVYQTGEKLELADIEKELRDAENTLALATASLPYTHMLLDPNSIFGVAASIIPLPNYNQAPRNVFQCGQARQAMGIYHSNQERRYDTEARILSFPAPPLFQPQGTEILGLNSLPSGQTVFAVFMTRKGFNQEDAFIFNRASIDRGLFHYTKYVTVKTTENTAPNVTEQIARPPIKTDASSNYLKNLDENGLPRIGITVNEKEVLIGKVRISGTDQKEDISITVPLGMAGMVDRVLVTENEDKQRLIKVRIRQYRRPIQGDKFSSRYGQKGTIGLILDETDMPWTIHTYTKYLKDPKTGEYVIDPKTNDRIPIKTYKSMLTPDVIVNPHAIPSRMTMGMMIELIASKVSVLEGERFDATAFRNLDLDQLRQRLHDLGYQRYGSEVLYDGMTGKRMEGLMYMGPCYYQALRHLVVDKQQARGYGAINPQTRQPTRGRKAGGAIRFGEMERDALITHGAMSVIQERLCRVSDGEMITYCRVCSTIAAADVIHREYQCHYCRQMYGKRGDFVRKETPHAFVKLTNLMNAMNYRTVPIFADPK